MSRRKTRRQPPVVAGNAPSARLVALQSGGAKIASPPGPPNSLPSLALVAATILAYLRVWHFGLVWDDAAHVTAPDLASLQGLLKIWSTPGATQQYYPALHSLFWLEHHIWGDSAAAHHGFNVLLHAGVVLLFHRLLQRLAVPGAFLAAAVFALHPVCVETVAWISEQKNTLSSLLYFAAALAYLNFDRDRQPRWYLTAIGLFLLALAAKTVTATLPAALLVIFWWKRGRLAGRGDVLPLVPWFVLSAGAGTMTAWMERTSVGAAGASYALSPVGRCLVAGRAAWFYFGKLIFPSDLMFIYPRWDIDPAAAWQYLYPAALLGVLAVLWVWRKRTRGPLAVALLFVGTLVPALGFINVFPFAFSFVADHFQYLAAAAMIAGLCAGVTLWSRRVTEAGSGAPRVAAAALLAVLAALTWRQTAMYHDADALWRTTLARNPRCWMACNNLGADLLQAGNLGEAVPLLERAVALAELNPAGHANLATARQMQGRLAEAAAEFQKTVELQPDNADAESNLGFALLQVGRREDALVHVHRALAINPDLGRAHLTLGNLLLETGHPDEALVQYRRAASLEPAEVETRTNLGTALAQLGRTSEAVGEFQQALLLQPGSAAAHLNLGNALLQQGRSGPAIAHFRRSLEIDPNSALACNNLGLALIESAQFEDAALQFRRALALVPSYSEAHQNLGTALLKLGRTDEANAQFQAAAGK